MSGSAVDESKTAESECAKSGGMSRNELEDFDEPARAVPGENRRLSKSAED